MTEPSIKTTVVGSYPLPTWLAALPSTPNLRDAILVILKTQELAGIDVIADGELSRFNINHPETNGMIDYFVAPMAGIETQLSYAELQAFRAQVGMRFRAQPAGVVRGALGPGLLNLPAAWELVKPLTTKPLKFTVTAPYMLAKTLVDEHYGDLRALTMALATVLRDQIAAIDAPIIQVDEANLPGHAEDAHWAHEPINLLLDAIQGERGLHLCFGNYGGQSVQRGTWGKLMDYLNTLQVDHIVMENAHRPPEELQVFRDLRPEIGMGLGVIDIKSNHVESADEVARAIETAEQCIG
ncbi:MAG: cobalamin-independent methionine synthase II family protein, partial [Caldilineaceae bacterium]|nr:cobalamin-independent methionine synthase II family protein [Caldilineaceae bacterium]